MKVLTEKDVDFNKLRYTEVKTADEFRKIWRQLQAAHVLKYYPDFRRPVNVMREFEFTDDEFVYQVTRLTMRAVGYLVNYGVMNQAACGPSYSLNPSRLYQFVHEFEDLTLDEVGVDVDRGFRHSSISNPSPELFLKFPFDAVKSRLTGLKGVGIVTIPCSYAFNIDYLSKHGPQRSRWVKLSYCNEILRFGFEDTTLDSYEVNDGH